MLEPFLTPDMVGSYDYSLVSLSALISILSTYAVLDFTERATATRGGG
jgi:NO-binding membrane sensor protein with MHYT domain